MLFRRLLAGTILALAAALARGALTPPNAPFTPKELAQGFRDEVILAKPRPGLRARVDAEEARGAIRVRQKFSRFGDLRIVEVDRTEEAATAIARLQATGLYEFVEPDFIYQPDVTIPNDLSFGLQWALNNTGQLTGSTVGVDLRATTGWDVIHDAPNVVVAVIDGGVRLDHADLAPNLWINPAPTFGDVNGAKIVRGVRSGDVADESGHGTHVAGIVGAVGNNGIAIAGVAWRVQLMILKNSGSDGSSASSDSAACLDYAVAHGAQIVNCSFGGTSFSQTFFTAIRAARDAGVIVVTSAGNSGLNNDTSPHYPSNFLLDNVVSVGNSGPTDSASSSSDYGASVELFAPGSAIQSLNYTSTTGITSKSGTSMAAPQVTGVLALMKAQFPTDTYRQLINRLLRGADIKTSLAGRALTNGRVNLQRALTTTTNRPFNDDFANRAIIAGPTLALRANNVGATNEGLEPQHIAAATGGSLWWHWVATTTGAVTIDTTGSSYDTSLAVYTGTSLAALTPVASNDDDGTKVTSRVTFNATSGIAYPIAVAGKAGATGYTQFNVSVTAPNDNFAAAVDLVGESAQASARNSAATLEAGEPTILGFAGGGSMWYRWAPPRTGRFQVSAFTRNFDSLLAVYTGTSLANLTLVAANDDAEVQADTNSDSVCTIDAVLGTTYYFQVDTKATAVRGELFISVTDSLWQASVGGDVTSAPSIAPDGTLYVGTTSPDRRMYALTPTGALKWSYAASGGIDICSPAIGSDGSIYFGSAEGRVVSLTSAGTVRWVRNLSLGTTASVSPALAADGTIYLHTSDGYLYALDPADGSTKWRYLVLALNTFASAVIAPDGTIYQCSDDHGLYALTPDGTLKWRYDLGSDTYATPALDTEGNIYLSTYANSRVISVTPDGTLRWTYTGATGTISGSTTLSADGSVVYVGAGDRKLHAINAADGTARWSYTTGNSIFACTPAVDTNGVIYIGAYDGKLYAINADGTLRRTWDTAQPIRSSPTIFGTTLYVGSRDAKLYAFDIGAAAAAGPWPQYRHNVRHAGRAVIDPLAVTVAPQARSAASGETISLSVTAIGQGPFIYQWSHNGTAIAGATAATYTFAGASADTGSYSVAITGPQGTVTSPAASIGLTTTSKVIGAATEIAANIPHPNTNIFDQILLEGAAASFTADPGQITRLSYVDLTNDIVQLEFTGAGTVSIVLDGPGGPAAPANYNQGTLYMKGHAGIVVTGADETTNLSVFSVGRGNAVNQALFKDTVTYDGFADIAFIAIQSTNGKFGGLRTANASYFATRGVTGLYAPGVAFQGPVFIGDINASDTATPTIVIGSGADTRINGGDLFQANGRAVQVAGLTQLQFVLGSTSHHTTTDPHLLPAQTNQARLEQDGVDVTAQVVVNP